MLKSYEFLEQIFSVRMSTLFQFHEVLNVPYPIQSIKEKRIEVINSAFLGRRQHHRFVFFAAS